MKHTVLDKMHSQTLLYMGLEEGLLELKPKWKDDKIEEFVKANYKPSEELKSSLLEQITLTPNLLTQEFEFLSKMKMRGYLFDQNFINDPKPDFSIEISNPNKITVPTSVLLSMLSSQGHNWSHGQVMKMLDSYYKVKDEYNNYHREMGEEPPKIMYIGFSKAFKDMIDERAYKVLTNHDKAYLKVSPIFDCYKEFIKLSYFAQDNNALIKVGIDNERIKPRNNNIDNEWKIYKLVVKELGVIPYRQTLKETFKLSSSSEAVGLRNQIDLWTNSIVTGNSSEFEKIKKEMRSAINSLHKAANYSKVGNWITYIGLPVSAAGLISPILGIPGVIVSTVGFISTGYSEYLSKINRWAMFGNKK